MLKRMADLELKRRVGIRGGIGAASVCDYLAAGEMAGVRMVSRVTLEPGSSVGAHPHPDAEELYVILEGEGEGSVDGKVFPVGPGDAFLCRMGHSHGLKNTGGSPLTFLAVLTPAH